MLAFLILCGLGRGKQSKNCGKSSSKYFKDFILKILIYNESIETWSRKRRMIQLFSTDFLKILSSLSKRSVTGPKGCFEFG